MDTEGSEEDFLAKGHESREMLSEFVRATYTAVKHPILEDGAKNGWQTVLPGVVVVYLNACGRGGVGWNLVD